MSQKNQNNISNDCSELFNEIFQKELNNNEKTFIGTKIYDISNEIDNSSK